MQDAILALAPADIITPVPLEHWDVELLTQVEMGHMHVPFPPTLVLGSRQRQRNVLVNPPTTITHCFCPVFPLPPCSLAACPPALAAS